MRRRQPQRTRIPPLARPSVPLTQTSIQRDAGTWRATGTRHRMSLRGLQCARGRTEDLRTMVRGRIPVVVATPRGARELGAVDEGAARIETGCQAPWPLRPIVDEGTQEGRGARLPTRRSLARSISTGRSGRAVPAKCALWMPSSPTRGSAVFPQIARRSDGGKSLASPRISARGDDRQREAGRREFSR